MLTRKKLVSNGNLQGSKQAPEQDVLGPGLPEYPSNQCYKVAT